MSSISGITRDISGCSHGESFPRTSSSSITSTTKTSTAAPQTPRISRWALVEIGEICNEQVCTPELDKLPKINPSELEIKGLLGEGGFASVCEVIYQNETYALKQIRKHKRGRDEEDWMLAVFDLCNEASILGKVAPHENIVKITGVCQSSVSEAYRSYPDGWFFLEEKLENTLSNRLNEWRRELKATNVTGCLSRFRDRRRSLPTMGGGSGGSSTLNHRLLSLNGVYERLESVALGIANAMKYLHSDSLRLAVRDLKPQNIGFDSNGIVKVFDLGMARPMEEVASSALAGTFRYLSPEALLGKPISMESDVYSFGIILFELVTLSKPYDEYFQRGSLVRKDSFIRDVIEGCTRPDLSRLPCRATSRLISRCWDPSPRSRPSFEKIHSMLLHILSTGRDRADLLRTMVGINHEEDTVPTSIVKNDDNHNNNNNNNNSISSASSSQYLPVKNTVTWEADIGRSDDSSCDIIIPCKKPSSSSSKDGRNGNTFRGLFRTLKPLPIQKGRACSDNTAATQSNSSLGTMSVSSLGNALDDEETRR